MTRPDTTDILAAMGQPVASPEPAQPAGPDRCARRYGREDEFVCGLPAKAAEHTAGGHVFEPG
jgi:hypothetical protein